MSTFEIPLGRARLTRVGYADIAIPPEVAGLTAEQVRAVPWGPPLWTEGDQLRAGAAVWIVEIDGECIAVDPAQAADEILRSPDAAAVHQEAFSQLLADAGFPRERVTIAVATHVEGVGMFAWRNDDGTWSPFFPNAPLLVSQRELDAIDNEGRAADFTGAWAALRTQGVVRGVTGDPARVTDDVSLVVTGAHTPGHSVVRISSEGEHAVMLGHLAVSPLHLVTGKCPQQHPDPETALAVLEAIRDEQGLLVGPLWPAPGAGRWNGNAFVASEPQ